MQIGFRYVSNYSTAGPHKEGRMAQKTYSGAEGILSWKHLFLRDIIESTFMAGAELLERAALT